VTLNDDLGRPVPLPSAVRRIISLAPSTTENLFAIGAGALVVGNTTACDYPPPAQHLPKVGNFYQPVYERIRTLKPDLILLDTATARRADMDNLQARLGAPVYVMQSRTYPDVQRQLLRLGAITGRQKQAAQVARGMAARAVLVEKRVAGKPRPTVFIQVDSSALYAAGPGTFFDDLIRRAGGVNVVKGATPFPLVSKEFLLASRPEFYLVTVPSGSRGVPTLVPALRGLPAVKAGRVRYLDANLVSRQTARLANGLEQLAGVLHPQT
jgi:iron complex transport system substrate-binding protein